jgi:hypothetical protein
VADHYPRQSDSRVISGSSVARNSRTARLPPPSSTGRCSGAAKKSSLRSDEAVGRASGSLCRHAATIWRNAGENSSLCNGRTFLSDQHRWRVRATRAGGGGGGYSPELWRLRLQGLFHHLRAPPRYSVSSAWGDVCEACKTYNGHRCRQMVARRLRGGGGTFMGGWPANGTSPLASSRAVMPAHAGRQESAGSEIRSIGSCHIGPGQVYRRATSIAPKDHMSALAS